VEHLDYEIPLEFDVMSARGSVGGPPRISAIMRFDSRDPHAILLTFYSQGEMPMCSGDTGEILQHWSAVPWRFSREILHAALTQTGGGMDVTAWPSTVAGYNYIYLRFRNAYAQSTFRVGYWVIMKFMEKVDQLVPIQRASDYVDIDAELARLLLRPEDL
jgi:hypothetical protein